MVCIVLFLCAAIIIGPGDEQPASQPIATIPPPCIEGLYGTWRSDCKMAHVWVDTLKERTQARIEIRYDGSDIRLSALTPLSEHQRYFSHTMPILAKFNTVPYVAMRDYFWSPKPAQMAIGTETYEMVWDGLPAWKIKPDDMAKAYSALSSTDSVNASYLTTDGPVSVAINTQGWNEVKTTIPQNSKQAVQSGTSKDALKIVRQQMVDNHLGLRPSELKVTANPHGYGYFVYAPKDHYPFNIIWFANAGRAYALSGSAKQITPAIPFPIDIDTYEVLEGTGLKTATMGSGIEISAAGKQMAFGE